MGTLKMGFCISLAWHGVDMRAFSNIISRMYRHIISPPTSLISPSTVRNIISPSSNSISSFSSTSSCFIPGPAHPVSTIHQDAFSEHATYTPSSSPASMKEEMAHDRGHKDNEDTPSTKGDGSLTGFSATAVAVHPPVPVPTPTLPMLAPGSTPALVPLVLVHVPARRLGSLR